MKWPPHKLRPERKSHRLEIDPLFAREQGNRSELALRCLFYSRPYEIKPQMHVNLYQIGDKLM
jgi:hypothetical protein